MERINLISEVFPPSKDNENKEIIAANTDSIIIAKSKNSSATTFDFELYRKPKFITNFQTGNQSSLPEFMEKLQRLKNGEHTKIRIAYFGDSMIEGDLLTKTLRALLQKEYGGSGVGFLPMFSTTSGFRQTATSSGEDWEEVNFMTKGAKNLYLSGHSFSGNGTSTFTDNTIKTTNIPIEKSLIFGNANSIIFNGNPVQLNPNSEVNRLVLSNDISKKIKINSNNSNSILYGVSYESESGVILDNFSFRGITGIELNKLSESFMKSIQENNHYDLIVLQYGVNLLFRPNDTNYDWYSKTMTKVLKKMKTSFPDSDFLIISSADRAFKYDGFYKTAIGMPNLIKSQALMAYENNFAFYNQFATMGGENSIVKWAEENPSQANKDYVHPNPKGAEILGQKLFEAIQNDYQNYTQKKK